MGLSIETPKHLTEGGRIDFTAEAKEEILADFNIIDSCAFHFERDKAAKHRSYDCVFCFVYEKADGQRSAAEVFFYEYQSEEGPLYGYSVIPEEAGPGIYLPIELLDQLTPTDNEEAQEWRADSKAAYMRQAAAE